MSVNNVVMQMGTSLASAKECLATAENQVVYWSAQVTKFEQACQAVTDIFGTEEMAMPAPKKGAIKAVSKRAHKNKELKTDSAFWLGLITEAPQKAAEITTAAANALGIKLDDADQIATLNKRRPMALQALIDQGKIKSQGERATRTYSL